MYWRTLVLAFGFLAAVLSAYLNAQDEVKAVAAAYQNLPYELMQYKYYAHRAVFYWMLLPFLILSIYAAGLVIVRAPGLNFGAAFVFLYLTAGVYLSYALNGPTAPDTAEHMHLVFVPVLWGGCVALPFSLYMLVQIGKARAAHRGKQETRETRGRYPY